MEKVGSYQELRHAASRIWAVGRGMLVQRPIVGRDYRIILLDGQVLSAYERQPLKIVGDGHSTIISLLRRLQKRFSRSGRDTVIDIGDSRIDHALKRKGFTMRMVLPDGAALQLLDVANLSLGGATVDITTTLHPSFIGLAREVSRAMNLRFCGIDILANDARRPNDGAIVLEVNSAPGLDNYLYRGRRNSDYVDSLYLKVLEAIAKGPAK